MSVITKDTYYTHQEIKAMIANSSTKEELKHIKNKILKNVHPDQNIEDEEELKDLTEKTTYCIRLCDERKTKLQENTNSEKTQTDPEIIIPEVISDYIDEDCYRNYESTATTLDILIPNTVYKIKQNAFRNVCWSTLKFEERKDDEPVFIAPGAFSQFKKKSRGHLPLQTIINMPQRITYNTPSSYYTPFDYCNIKCFQMYKCTKYVMVDLYPQVKCVNLNDITDITFRMFYDCGDLIKVSGSENITSITAGAFKYCYSLEELFLPNIKSVAIGSLAKCSKVRIKTHKDQIPLFKDAFGDAFENHRSQFIEI